MIIPTCRTNREEFMEKLKKLGDFDITEQIMDSREYKMSPLVKSFEEESKLIEKKGDIFFPLKSIEFRYLEIKFKLNQ